jgi:negative regulator of sigma E activity
MKPVPSPSQAPAAAPLASSAAGTADAAEAERLSAWLDGEPAGEQADELSRRLLRDARWRSRYVEWCAVGDALRSQEVIAGHSPRLCARIGLALRDEPALLAPRALPGAARRYVATGIAVAAAAAVLVLVAVPQMRGAGSADALADAAAPGVHPADKALAAADPGARAAAAKAGAYAFNPRLDPYIEAHREVTGTGVMPAAAVYLRFGSEGEQ